MLTPSLLIVLAPLVPDPLVLAPLALNPGAPAPSAPLAGLGAGFPLAFQDDQAEAEEAPPEPPSWTGAFNLGSAIASGNTNTRSVNLSFDAVLDRSQALASNRWTLKAWYNYSDEEVTGTSGSRAIANNLYGMAKYDHFLSPKNYLFGNASGEEDELQDLDLRAIIGAGYGRQIRDDEKLSLATELGVAYRQETFENAPETSSPNAQLGVNFDWKFRKGWSLINSSQLYPSLEDKNNVYAKADTRVRTDLNEDLFLQLQWVFDWNNQPAPTNKTVDNRIILTLGWSF